MHQSDPLKLYFVVSIQKRGYLVTVEIKGHFRKFRVGHTRSTCDCVDGYEPGNKSINICETSVGVRRKRGFSKNAHVPYALS